MYKKELYLSKIRKFIDKKEIKVITGIEKCGKTQLLKQIIDELKICKIASENIIYLSLKYNEIRNHLDLNKYIFKQIENLNGKLYLFFDEIQLVSNWEQSINEYTRNLNCDIYIASSNSKVLSKLANYVKIDVYPFSFSEILDYKRKQELFNSYLKYGGFPRILEFNDDEKIEYLTDSYYALVFRQIVYKNNIRNFTLLETLLKFLIDHIGQKLSINSIKNHLKDEDIHVSTNTISTYITYLTDAFILFKVERKDLKTDKVIMGDEKYYCIDPGFYYLKSGNNYSKSKILENIVFLELIRRGYSVNIGKENLDFICKKDDKTIYIQVSESILDENTRKREFNPLEQINDNCPKYVLTLDEWDYSQNGITHLNIIEFLKSNTI